MALACPSPNESTICDVHRLIFKLVDELDPEIKTELIKLFVLKSENGMAIFNESLQSVLGRFSQRALVHRPKGVSYY